MQRDSVVEVQGAMLLQVRVASPIRDHMNPSKIGSVCWQPEVQMAKQAKAKELQHDWQQQIHDKAEHLRQFEHAEESWPYSPPKQAHARVALTPPKNAAQSTVAAWGVPAKRSLA